MDAEEKLFEQRFGKKQPFTVPDGYFDQLAERVMERLPEQQPASVPQVSVGHKWRRWAGYRADGIVGLYGATFGQ